MLLASLEQAACAPLICVNGPGVGRRMPHCGGKKGRRYAHSAAGGVSRQRNQHHPPRSGDDDRYSDRACGRTPQPIPSASVSAERYDRDLSVLMAAHILEVFAWSVAYAVVNAAPDDANLVYFAFVNYTTLGYGDVTPLAKWRLLGPMTAMNGVLMFGWSTALIFEVLIKAIDQDEKSRRGP
jgi:Ion channel